MVCKFYVMLLLLFVMTFCYNADLISCALHYVFFFFTKRVITKRHEPIGFQVDEKQYNRQKQR